MTRREPWDDPNRWRQATPRPPVISPDQRRRLAHEWLDFLDVQASDNFVDRLAAVVMRYHPLSPKGQIANDLVRDGAVPYRARVEAAYRDWCQSRGPSQISREEVNEVLSFIKSVNLSTHAGPTWKEIDEHLGWPRWKTRHVLTQLQQDQEVTFTREPRSLFVSHAP